MRCWLRPSRVFVDSGPDKNVLLRGGGLDIDVFVEEENASTKKLDDPAVRTLLDETAVVTLVDETTSDDDAKEKTITTTVETTTINHLLLII